MIGGIWLPTLELRRVGQGGSVRDVCNDVIATSVVKSRYLATLEVDVARTYAAGRGYDSHRTYFFSRFDSIGFRRSGTDACYKICVDQTINQIR